MKVYLKSGQVMKLNEVHSIAIDNVCYGVGKYYDVNVDDKFVSILNVFELCKDNKGSCITFYFGLCNCVDTMTDDIIAIMLADEEE